MNLVKHGLKWMSVSVGLLAVLAAIIYIVMYFLVKLNVPTEVLTIVLFVLGWGGAFALLWIYMYLYKKAGHFKISPVKDQIKLARFFKWCFGIILLIILGVVILGVFALGKTHYLTFENILVIIGLIFLVIFFIIKNKKLKKLIKK